MSSILSTLSTYQTGLNGRQQVARLTAEVQTATEEVASGLRADVFADLGMRAAQSIELRNRMERTDRFIVTNELLVGELDITVEAISTMRDAVQDVLTLSATSIEAPNETAALLQQQARAALDVVMRGLNTSYGGKYLFGGLTTDTAPMQGLDSVHPGSGFSPRQVVEGIVGTGPASPADAAAMVAALDEVFASDPAAGTLAFEETFYRGTDLGATTPRLSSLIDEGDTMTYGIQANDPAFTEAIKGLMLLASVDVTQITDRDAYRAYMGDALQALSDGIAGMDDARVTLGNAQVRLDNTITRQHDLSALYNIRILGMEGADPYEAAARLTAFQTQLEATYATTAQIARLSFLNYI